MFEACKARSFSIHRVSTLFILQDIFLSSIWSVSIYRDFWRFRKYFYSFFLKIYIYLQYMCIYIYMVFFNTYSYIYLMISLIFTSIGLRLLE